LKYVAFAGIIVEWWVGQVGLGPCDSVMGWVWLGDVKWTHVHLWLARELSVSNHDCCYD